MNLILRRVRQSGRIVAAASLAALLSTSFPLAAFAQEGIVARQQPPATPPQPSPQPGQQQQQPRPPDTPPQPRQGNPASDLDKIRERQNEQGEQRPVQPTEREKRGIPSPRDLTSTPSVQTPQTTTEAPQTGDTSITQPLALSPEVGRQRVGVTEDQKLSLTLQDAIALALQNNLDIEYYRQGVQVAQYNLFAARGVYDIVSGTNINYQSRTLPVTSVISGGGTTGSLSTKVFTYDFNTSQLIQSTGGSWRVDFNNDRTTTTSTFTTLSPSYNPSLQISVTQPLMRNFAIDTNRRTIQLLKQSLDLSDSQFRQRVIEIISSVQRAYWDPVFAIRNEQISRENVELTRTQLQNNQMMVEAGTLPPIDLRSTEAALEARKGDVITALQNITSAENVLKGLLIKDQNDKMWNSEIEPVDQPQIGQPSFNLQEATTLALKNRPELEQMQLQQRQNQINLSFFKNQLKPQLDLVGFYTNTGTAGTSTRPDAPPVPGENVAVVPERFQGGYIRSLRNLFSFDFKIYQVGVTISFPWRNRTAEGNYGRTLAEGRQLDARQRQLIQSVQIEVRNALQNVEATRQRFEAAQAGRIAAQAQLQGEQEKFRAGLSTNFFVLERQNDLAIARGSEVRALTDYNKAIADLQRVTGMTLINNNVQVTALPANGGSSTK